MAKQKIFSQIFFSFIVVIILAITASAWRTSDILKSFYLSHIRQKLEDEAKIARNDIQDILKSRDFDRLQAYCKKFTSLSSSRTTIIDISGKVVADSDENPQAMGNHSDRDEIKAAFKGATGNSIRYSFTLKERMMYVAIPVIDSGKVSWVIRLAVPITSIDENLKSIYLKIIFFSFLIAAIAAAVVSIIISRKISGPIQILKTAASSYARGDFNARLPVSEIEDIASLSLSLRHMADKINSQFAEITHEHNRQEAILSSMHEGVIAMDSEDRIILINKSASELLNINTAQKGRTFQEVIRNPDIWDFIAGIVSTGQTTEDELEIPGNESKSINLRGTALKDSNGKTIGTLVVLNDITRLKKLEKIRSEFASNVSHELKTPLTVIKASVETILDGNQDKNMDKLLTIIQKHTERLSSLVDDILSLSELESREANGKYKFEEIQIRDVIDSAINICNEKTESKKITVEVKCEKNLRLKVNAPLIEQALVNLIDNAIKYSDENSKVEICGTEKENSVILRVKDYGCGIPKDDLPRIFERFYRVDKARSRKQGGTGLGLSIVKHIANAHHGKIEVESEPSKGSIFSILLPKSL